MSKNKSLNQLYKLHLNTNQKRIKKIHKQTLQKAFFSHKRQQNQKPNSKNEKIERKNVDNQIKQYKDIQEKDLQCPICYDLLINAQVTICGHLFCQKCLEETLFKFNQCPICKYKIFKKISNPCKTIQYMIQQYLENDGYAQNTNYQNRVLEFKDESEKKKVKEFHVGQQIDVKDSEGIWCVGIVLDVFKNKNHHDTLLIHYADWSKIYDEYICSNSNRIAAIGCYTNRKDIPLYMKINHNDEQVRDSIHRQRNEIDNLRFYILQIQSPFRPQIPIFPEFDLDVLYRPAQNRNQNFDFFQM